MKKKGGFGQKWDDWVYRHRPTLLHPQKSWFKYLSLKAGTGIVRGSSRLVAGTVRETYYALTPERLPDDGADETLALWEEIANTPPLDLQQLARDIAPTNPELALKLITPDLTPPPVPQRGDAMTYARWREDARRFLLMYHYGSPALLAEPIQQILADYAKLIPKEGPFSVPIADLLPDLPAFVEKTITRFFTEDIQEHGLYRSLQDKLDANAHDEKGQFIPPTKSKAPSAQLPNIYFKGTPLDRLLDETVPFGIPPERWASHGVIFAPPEHGKTQLIGTLITTFLKEGIAPIFIDPHGDLFDLLADRLPDALILDPDKNPPALNFFDYGELSPIDTLQTFSFLMSALSGGLSDKQGGIVPYLLKLLRVIPNASIETLRLLLDEKPKRMETSRFIDDILKLPDVDQGFFRSQFFSHTMQATKDAIGWKLYAALASDTFRQMFSATTNSFDADAVLRDRRTVLIKGGETSLGEQGMEIFLQFIVSLFYSAAKRRQKIPIEKRTLSVLCVDEAHRVFNPQISNFLTECRKYRVGFLGATQLLEQVPSEVKAALYGATAIRFVGPVAGHDASTLAREMYTTEAFIRSMTAVPNSHAEWAFHLRGRNHCYRLKAEYGVVEAMPTFPRRKRADFSSEKKKPPEPPSPDDSGKGRFD